MARPSLDERQGARHSDPLKRQTGANEELSGIESGGVSPGGGWSGLLDPAVRPALILGIVFAVCRLFTGFSVVLYGYAPTIIEHSGVDTASIAILATVGTGLLNVSAAFLVLPIIDRLGRRPLVLSGLAEEFLSLAALGIALLIPARKDS